VPTRRLAFVVGHENWGKSETLRALIDISDGHGRKVTIDGSEFLVRRMSNDDKPRSYRNFMNSISRPYAIAALCPKFKKLQNYDDPMKVIDAVLQSLRERGYGLFFWVIEHKWREPARVIGREELAELRQYGTVGMFQGRDVEAGERARRLRSFVSNVVLA
jgi:hypothetical protein